MKRDLVLILEDDAERVAGFHSALAELGPGYEMRVWRNAHAMISQSGDLLGRTFAVSLDHDLNPVPGETGDPGTGLDVATWLAQHTPVCPVVVHSSNHERVESMLNEFRLGGWNCVRVAPAGPRWISGNWSSALREIANAGTTGGFPFTEANARAADHEARLGRALLAFEGVAVGDAFGQRFFGSESDHLHRVTRRLLPPSPWTYTDDTAMTASVVEVLGRFGFIERRALAQSFAGRYSADPRRGYGATAQAILGEISEGRSWIDAAGRVFGGAGSMGNGAAMRAAPIGAYFSGSADEVIRQAAYSAEVTHAHREGKAGAIAVALAAAWAERERGSGKDGVEMLEAVSALVPDGSTRRGIDAAARLPLSLPPELAARQLGNGSRITAPDTVPICLWLVARHLHDFREAMWATVSIAGDLDTNCAIVGGIVAVASGIEGIPAEWRAAREGIQLELVS